MTVFVGASCARSVRVRELLGGRSAARPHGEQARREPPTPQALRACSAGFQAGVPPPALTASKLAASLPPHKRFAPVRFAFARSSRFLVRASWARVFPHCPASRSIRGARFECETAHTNVDQTERYRRLGIVTTMSAKDHEIPREHPRAINQKRIGPIAKPTATTTIKTDPTIPISAMIPKVCQMLRCASTACSSSCCPPPCISRLIAPL